MKQLTAVLLCLLLCGCARQASPAPTETFPEETVVTVTAGLYDPDHPVEQKYPGLVRAYPLTLKNVYAIHALGKDVLVLSGQGNTTLTVFSGDALYETASLSLDFRLTPENPSLQIHESGISFFDPVTQETIVLDASLQETRRIKAPDGLSGKPLFSVTDHILYYCTDWSVIAWDLDSGIRRTLKELSYDAQELTGLHMDSRILECTILDSGKSGKLLFSADRGLDAGNLGEDALLNTGNSRYFAVLPDGYQTLLVFGREDADPELLLPGSCWDQQFYLPEDHAAVTVSSSEDGTQLHYYELNTGILRSALTLDAPQTPAGIVNTKDHAVYILIYDPAADCDVLYRWDVLRQPPEASNVTSYTAAYRSKDNPDPAALEACRKYAETIGEKYGITLRIWEDALEVQPWDYRFEPETLAPILEQELKLLDQRLGRYPDGILEQTKSHFTGLTICLVRKITGIEDDRSLTTATGIQFFENNEAYVIITTGKHSEQALYHELYHVMETHLLTESTGLDQWETLNPSGFVYGDDQQDADIYLQGQTRAFVDRYSMRYLKEDRARIMENAMLPDRQELFRTEYLQRKLLALCTSLREAYGLKKHTDPLPWEQYLIQPLAPQS